MSEHHVPNGVCMETCVGGGWGVINLITVNTIQITIVNILGVF